jgi:PIN domain nuclease of toxin-antitoxin system
MRLLLDTHLLLWLAAYPERLASDVLELVEDSGNDLCFSVTAIWETAIKFNREGMTSMWSQHFFDESSWSMGSLNC